VTDIHMQKAVRRINEAKECGETEVDLSGFEIQEIPEELLRLATTLKSLNLSDTDISDIKALSNLIKLEKLILYETNITAIEPLSGLTKLKILDLQGAEITNIRALANLTNLEWLGLSDANVSDVSPLAHLTNLEWLGLSDTDISDISPLANLTNLEALDLLGCPLVKSPANIQALKKLSENDCEIYGAEGLMK